MKVIVVERRMGPQHVGFELVDIHTHIETAMQHAVELVIAAESRWSEPTETAAGWLRMWDWGMYAVRVRTYETMTPELWDARDDDLNAPQGWTHITT